MPEPNDHRAQAERWLGKAAGPVDSEWDVRIAEVEALIGIGHALLARSACMRLHVGERPPGYSVDIPVEDDE